MYRSAPHHSSSTVSPPYPCPGFYGLSTRHRITCDTHVPSKSTRYQVPRIDLRGRSLGDVAQGERIPSSLPSRVVHIGE